MKRTLTRLTLIALLASAAAAYAAPPGFEGRGGDQGGQRTERHDDGRRADQGRFERHDGWRDDRREAWRDDRHDGWRDDRHEAWRYGARDYAPRQIYRDSYYYPQPYGYYRHDWRRGERLPPAYYGRPYIVRDYDDYRLYAPPRGCQWVRVDGDVLLTAIATGVVIDVLRDFYH